MLPYDTMLALLSFAFVTSITPGPNNIMLTASGVNFGFARTIPHMLGIGAGFVALLLAVGFGIGSIFALVPATQSLLKVAGALYMLWLAWNIAKARRIDEPGAAGARPMSFLAAALFQWVNVKAWVMALGAIAIYVRPSHALVDVLTVALLFWVVNLPCVSSWAGFGHALRNFLRDPVKVRVFNVAMALLLVASIVPMVLS